MGTGPPACLLSHRSSSTCGGELWPQDFLHRLSFGELIDQLVQIADFLHQWIFDFFDSNAAHYALYLGAVRMEGWGLGQKF